MDDDYDSDDSHVFGSGSIGSAPVQTEGKEVKARKPRHRSKKKSNYTKTDVNLAP